jgi:hypothetical protein
VIVVFHTAKIVLVVSAVVAVVMVVVAASPTARLQPPKVYPALVVEVVLANEAVESARVSPTRLAVSVGGKELARVLALKMIVGSEAEIAWAGVPKPKTPAKTSEAVRATAVDLLWIRTVFIFYP